MGAETEPVQSESAQSCRNLNDTPHTQWQWCFRAGGERIMVTVMRGAGG